MIIRKSGYKKKFILGGSMFTPLWNLIKKYFSILTPKALDFGKTQVLNLASKGAETLGKNASEQVKEKFFNIIKNKKNKNGINNLETSNPNIIKHEVQTTHPKDTGINRGLGILS